MQPGPGSLQVLKRRDYFYFLQQNLYMLHLPANGKLGCREDPKSYAWRILILSNLRSVFTQLALPANALAALPARVLLVFIPSWLATHTSQIKLTVNFLTDTSTRRTPLYDGYLLSVPVVFQSFYYYYTLHKTDTFETVNGH